MAGVPWGTRVQIRYEYYELIYTGKGSVNVKFK
jgi:hypothetical protein